MAKPLLRDLLEGEDSTPVAEGVWPTPAQWLYKFNRVDPKKRLEIIEIIINDAQVSMECIIGDHAGAAETLERREEQIRALQRELSTKKRQLRQKNRRV